MRISDWSSDVCSSDLNGHEHLRCLRRKQVRKRRAEEREQRRRSARSGVRVVARGLRSADAVHGGEAGGRRPDRKSVVWGKSVSVRVDLGGRRIIKKKKKTTIDPV